MIGRWFIDLIVITRLVTEGWTTQTRFNWQEATCGMIFIHDNDGIKLYTLSLGQMAAKNKNILKHC